MFLLTTCQLKFRLFRFGEYSVPDVITANGIYDTTTQTMTFGESDDYMKYMATRSNLDRYKNVFESDMMNAYGGPSGAGSVSPSTEKTQDDLDSGSYRNELAGKLKLSTDNWVFLIQSSILV